LALDQQDYLSGRLRALPPEQRRDVLAEWDVRCATGAVRDAAAYLFGLIRKALQGTFRLWAARKGTVKAPPAPKSALRGPLAAKDTMQGQPAAKVREAPKPPAASGVTATGPAEQPASREAALAYIQRIKAAFRGATPAIRAGEHPDARSPAPRLRAMARASVRVVTARRSDDPANWRNNTASSQFLFRVARMMMAVLH
jgi:hypothetical protein